MHDVAALAAASAAFAAAFVASAIAAAILISVSDLGIAPPDFKTPILYVKFSLSLSSDLTRLNISSLFRLCIHRIYKVSKAIHNYIYISSISSVRSNLLVAVESDEPLALNPKQHQHREQLAVQVEAVDARQHPKRISLSAQLVAENQPSHLRA